MHCCEDYEESIGLHLPRPILLVIREEITHLNEMNDPNFPRRLNRYLRPVIQNAKIASQMPALQRVLLLAFLMRWIPFVSFLSMSMLFSMPWNVGPLKKSGVTSVESKKIVLQNATLRTYLRKRFTEAVEKTECFVIVSTDTGINLQF
jgi:hypothetical protein